MRVVAMAGVVLIHLTAARMSAGPSLLTEVVNALGRFAVPTFMAVSGYLHVQSMSRSGSSGALLSRMRRLVPAYVVWSAIYLVDAAIRTPEVSWTASRATRTVLLGGAGYHLWFIPALISLQLVASLASTSARRRSLLALGLALGVVTVFGPAQIAAGEFWTWLGMGASALFDRTLVAMLLPYALGMVVADLPDASGRWLRFAAPIMLLAGFAIATTIVWARHDGTSLWVVENRRLVYYCMTVAVAFIVTSAAVRDRRLLGAERLAPLAPLSFGVYLIHPLLRPVVLDWLPASSLPSWQWIPLSAIALLTLSGLATWVLLRIPYVRRTLG